MPRQINQVITVTLVQGPQVSELRPATFTWRRSRYIVADVLDRWHEIGRWWEQEAELVVWRVMTRDQGVFELAMARKQPPEWRLMAIYD
jgi:hypothetical protein